MIAIQLALAGLILVAMAAASIWLGRRIAPGTPVPMQWGFDRKPSWYAPRGRALSLVPGFSAVILLAIGSGIARGTPIAQANLSQTVLILALALAACHALHLYLVWRWLRSRPAGEA